MIRTIVAAARRRMTTVEPWWYAQDRETFLSYCPTLEPTIDNIRALMNFEPTTPPEHR
jgi:hypothetical protein